MYLLRSLWRLEFEFQGGAEGAIAEAIQKSVSENDGWCVDTNRVSILDWCSTEHVMHLNATDHFLGLITVVPMAEWLSFNNLSYKLSIFNSIAPGISSIPKTFP